MRWSTGSNRRRVRGPAWIGALLLGLVMPLLVAAPTRAASTAATVPNTSIVFYKATSTTTGTAQFGTLANGVLTLKAKVSTGRWSHAAVTRDTVLFYNSSSGKGVTGTLVNGVFTKKGTFQIATGFNRIAASCDTVLFYNRTTGDIGAGLLKGGTLSGFGSGDFEPPGFDLISSSCDTIYFYQNPTGGFAAQWRSGLLQGGRYTQKFHGGSADARIYTHLTNTADSYLLYSKGLHFGYWGSVTGGNPPGFTDQTDTFGTWTRIAGTGDSILFYDPPTGLAARSTLRNGVYTFQGSNTIATRWKVIAGGR